MIRGGGFSDLICQEFLQTFDSFLQSFGRYFAVFVIFPLITVVLLYRLIKEKKQGETNYIRLILLLIFSSVFFLKVISFIGIETTLIPEEVVGIEANDFSIYNFGLGLSVSLGLVLAAYLNQVKSFYYTSLFIFFGLFLLFLYTGTSLILMPYIVVSGILGVLLQLYSGFKLRDNGALGIGIFFIIAFITTITQRIVNPIIGITDAILDLLYLAFGLVLALGYFTPFKPVEFGGN